MLPEAIFFFLARRIHFFSHIGLFIYDFHDFYIYGQPMVKPHGYVHCWRWDSSSQIIRIFSSRPPTKTLKKAHNYFNLST